MTTKTITSVGLALILFAISFFAVTSADARGRFICGAVQASYFGTGSNLARQWATDFPHTSTPAVDVVVVQARAGRALGGSPGGHVSRIVQPISECRALVADEKGQYVRDICKNRIALVVPRAGIAIASNDTAPRVKHSRQRGHIQHASYAAPDRHQIN